MAYGTKFILSYQNDLNELFEIYFEFQDYTGASVNLIGAENVFTYRSTAGDEDRLNPINGSEVTIGIFVDKDSQISINDFITEEDNEIRVTVFKDYDYDTFFWQGFVVVEDNSQPFLDPPFTLTIKAVDGLGLLKNIPLTDSDGNVITGHYSIIQWLAQILYLTGQKLKLRTYFNFYNSEFLNIASPLFETELFGTTFQTAETDLADTNPADKIKRLGVEDCYTALEKIARCFRSKIFQEDGCWHFINLFEYMNGDGYTYFEYSIGEPVGGLATFTNTDIQRNIKYLSVNVGKNEIIHPVNDDAVIYTKLATKSIELTYSYDQSLNKICNQNLSEGVRNNTYDELISSSVIDTNISPAVNLQTNGYDAYCYSAFGQDFILPTLPVRVNPSPPASSHQTFVREVLDAAGYEMQRFLVIKDDGGTTFMRTSSFLVDAGDRIDFSIDVRTRAHVSTSVAEFACVLFEGDDNSVWTLLVDNNPSAAVKWYDSSVPARFVTLDLTVAGTSIDSWNTISTTSAPNPYLLTVPGSGKIMVYLFALTGLTGSLETWFKNIQITVHPYLNGGYEEVKGDYNYAASNKNIIQTENDNVEISDSPKRYFKGALMNQGGDSVSPPNWHRYGITESYRFTQLMEVIMYSLLSRQVQKIEGSFRGHTYLKDGVTTFEIHPSGMLNNYFFIDSATPDKRYIMTSFERDMATGISRCVFVEVLKDSNDDGWHIPDVQQFQYLF